MTEQMIHITAPIDRDDLEALIAGLQAACGGNHIVVTECFDLVVKDERQAAALKALFGENGDKREKMIAKTAAMPKRSVGKSRSRALIEPRTPATARRPMRAWRVFLPDSAGIVSEQITIEEKALRLAKGEFEPGTILHHPRTGRQRVIGSKGYSQGLESECEVHHD